jgi:hypothetical protein
VRKAFTATPRGGRAAGLRARVQGGPLESEPIEVDVVVGEAGTASAVRNSEGSQVGKLAPPRSRAAVALASRRPFTHRQELDADGARRLRVAFQRLARRVGPRAGARVPSQPQAADDGGCRRGLRVGDLVDDVFPPWPGGPLCTYGWEFSVAEFTGFGALSVGVMVGREGLFYVSKYETGRTTIVTPTLGIKQSFGCETGLLEGGRPQSGSKRYENLGLEFSTPFVFGIVFGHSVPFEPAGGGKPASLKYGFKLEHGAETEVPLGILSLPLNFKLVEGEVKFYRFLGAYRDPEVFCRAVGEPDAGPMTGSMPPEAPWNAVKGSVSEFSPPDTTAGALAGVAVNGSAGFMGTQGPATGWDSTAGPAPSNAAWFAEYMGRSEAGPCTQPGECGPQALGEVNRAFFQSLIDNTDTIDQPAVLKGLGQSAAEQLADAMPQGGAFSAGMARMVGGGSALGAAEEVTRAERGELSDVIHTGRIRDIEAALGEPVSIVVETSELADVLPGVDLSVLDGATVVFAAETALTASKEDTVDDGRAAITLTPQVATELVVRTSIDTATVPGPLPPALAGKELVLDLRRIRIPAGPPATVQITGPATATGGSAMLSAYVQDEQGNLTDAALTVEVVDASGVVLPGGSIRSISLQS